ncbi:MAG TPA: PEGA domain-containing protein [Kofleriaceae bacterium]|nr:PEGA domain-containing protein [Kofleriaceae bacterium]
MRAWLCSVVVAAGLAGAGIAAAAPKVTAPKVTAPKVAAEEQLRLAEQHQRSGKYEEALSAIEAGLAVAPKDDALLALKAEVLLRTNDEPNALDAYKALAKVLPPGAKKREVQKIISSLTTKLTTFVEVAITNGPADVIQFDLRRRGPSCRGATSCNKPLAPGEHKVAATRSGFEPWSGRVTAVSGKTETLTVTLIESPSPLTVRVTPANAAVTVDGTAYADVPKVAAGKHEVVISLEGHESARREVVAALGKPVELDVTLARLVPVRIAAPGAKLQPVTALQLDGQPIVLQDGTLRLQPGPHKLEVTAPGFQPRPFQIPADPAPGYQIAVVLEPVVVARRGSWLTRRRIVALAAGGLGLAAVGTGAALGRQANQLEANGYILCPDPAVPCRYAAEATDFNERGTARALQANIAFGVAGAAALTATVLWLTGGPGSPRSSGPRESREPRMAVLPRLGSRFDSAGLDVAVRF